MPIFLAQRVKTIILALIKKKFYDENYELLGFQEFNCQKQKISLEFFR